jgi:hypothetical protein
MAFSLDGSQILLGNGAGGELGGSHAGLMFAIPAAGGSSSTALVPTVPFHTSLLAAPIGASTTRYFIDQGTDLFGTGSKVSVFDSSAGTNIDVISSIPGASSSMALDSSNNLYVGIGFGAAAGELRMFSQAALTAAYAGTPIPWTSGTVFNTNPNNSGAGMGFDARGFLFVGGPDGVTVFDPAGNSQLYHNGGYTQIALDPTNDRVLVTGFGNFQGLYDASTFLVPEPSAFALAATGGFMMCWKLRRRLRSTRRID